MFTCPECGKRNVKVIRHIRMIEYWVDDDIVESEEDLLYERDPDISEIECQECGYNSPYLDEWIEEK